MFYVQTARIIATLVAIAAVPLAQVLPDWMGWENQPIENANAAVALLGMIAACVFQHRNGGQWAWFWRATALVWFILFARELSWGAVFYPPTQMTRLGPFFSSRELWYRPVIYPLVGLLVAATCYIILRYRTWQIVRNLIRGDGAPWLEAALAIFCMAISISAEGHGGPLTGWIGGQSLVLEEAAELAAFLWVVAGQYRVREFELRSRSIASG
jgi:hypothetical protein